MAFGDALSKLSVKVSADTAGLNTALTSTQSKLGKLGSSIQQHHKAIGMAMTGMGMAVTGALAMCLKAYAEEQKGIVKLSTAMGNMGLSYDAVEQSLESWINTMQQKTAVADSDMRDSLTTLIGMTGDLTKSQDLLTLAMDMSAGTGKDLASSTDLIGYALAGNWGMVNRMIPALKAVETEEERWAMLRQLFAGQAEAYGETVAGQMQLLKNNMGDVSEAIGSAFLPMVTDLAAKIMPLIESIKAWISAHPELAKKITLVVAAIGGLMLVLGPLLIMLPALGMALTIATGPIGLVIIAITALIAIGVLLYKNWDNIKVSLTNIWNNLVTAAQTAFGYIYNIIDTYVLAPIRAIINLWKQLLAMLGFGGGGGAMEYAPYAYQHGGIALKPQLAMLGEKGPEAVLPLGKGGFGGDTVININFPNQPIFFENERSIMKLANKIGDRLDKTMIGRYGGVSPWHARGGGW